MHGAAVWSWSEMLQKPSPSHADASVTHLNIEVNVCYAAKPCECTVAGEAGATVIPTLLAACEIEAVQFCFYLYNIPCRYLIVKYPF